jgi:hypothetical protein
MCALDAVELPFAHSATIGDPLGCYEAAIKSPIPFERREQE